MDFSKRIKELSKERGFLMKDLAAQLGITPTGLSKSIGQSYPQLQTLERIADVLKVDVSELFSPARGIRVTCPKCGTVIEFKQVEDGSAEQE